VVIIVSDLILCTLDYISNSPHFGGVIPWISFSKTFTDNDSDI